MEVVSSISGVFRHDNCRKAHSLLREAEKAIKEVMIYANADNETRVIMYPQSVDYVDATLSKIRSFLDGR